MEYNKSLSARVRRRNAQGFLGIGNHKDFSCGNGDYTSREYNHKSTTNSEHYNLVKLCKNIGIKHPGSKSMATLRSHIYKGVNNPVLRAINNTVDRIKRSNKY